jgi:hypothetical protein
MNYLNNLLTVRNGKIRYVLTVPMVGLVLGLPLSAQDAADSESEEVVELSPFVVSGSDSGYYATETLSGTNLKTDMRSLANPITVMTEELMGDLGATSYKDVVDFLPSSGSYDGDTADPEGEQARRGTPFVSRGFRVAQLTQNFLATNVRQDNYNTERLTQSRGPNSLLFGLGSVGGAIDVSPIRGMFGSDFAKVVLRFDEFGRKRSQLDVNREMIDDKLALRVAGLYDKTETFRDLEFSRRKSIYGDLSYKPFKRTTIRINAEDGSIEENFPRLYLTKDWITPWTSSTLPIEQKSNLTDLDLVVNGPAGTRNTASNIVEGVQRRHVTNNYLVWIANDPSLGVTNWKFKGYGSQPVIDGKFENNVSLMNPQLTADVYYPLETVPAGPTDRVSMDYTRFSATLEQQIAENTYLQVIAATEDFTYDDFRAVRREDWNINIDTNYYLPTQRASDNPNPGQPLNPYFGVPYIESNPFLLARATELDQIRANLSHKIDLTGVDLFGKFNMGEIQMVGSFYRSDNENRLTQQDEMTLESVLPNGTLNNLQGRIWRRWYISTEAPTYPNIPWEPLSQPGDPSVGGNIIPAVRTAFVNRLPPLLTEETTESLFGIVQWRLFNDRLSLTGGYREDEYSASSMAFQREAGTNLFEGYETGVMGDVSKSKVDNYNVGAVVRPFRDFDFFINKSTNNVNASVSRFDVFGELLPPEEGEGTDYGVRAFFFEDTIVVKLNYYQNTQMNVISNPLRDGGDAGVEMARLNGRVERLLNSLAAGGYADLTEGAIRYGDYPGNQLWTDIEDIESDGYELEITANLTKEWRLMFNMSKQNTALNETYKTFKSWYATYVEPIKNDAAILELRDPRFGDYTVERIIEDMDRKIQFHQSQVGGQLVRSSRWAWNLITSYRFSEGGWWKSLQVGTAMRWREAPAIGYPENADGSFDTRNPFTGDNDFTTDIWFQRPIRLGKGPNALILHTTLRVTNVFDDGPYISRTGVDDGTGNLLIVQRTFKQPRTFELEVTVKF